jgi:hypothetical protein
MNNLKLQLKIKNYKVENGNVLLLALLVMAGIMTAALGIGAIILNEIRQARDIDFSTVAYYAAESGVEQALYKIRKEDALLGCPTGACDVNGYCSSGDSCAGDIVNGVSSFRNTLDNQSSWSRIITDKEGQIYGKIDKDNSMQVDLYDPEGTAAAGVESIKIEWTPQCAAPGDVSMIEVSYIGWDPAVGWSAATEQKFKYSAPESPAVINVFSNTKSYRVRIKALYCDVSNVRVTAWGSENAGNPPISIPARIILTSTGQYGTLRQAVKMIMPRKSPMSGLYDYVLFSECSLVKGEAATCP